MTRERGTRVSAGNERGSSAYEQPCLEATAATACDWPPELFSSLVSPAVLVTEMSKCSGS